MPLGVVGVFTLTSFILGCVATDMANNNAAAIANHLKTKPQSQCAFGDQLYGEPLHGTFAQEGVMQAQKHRCFCNTGVFPLCVRVFCCARAVGHDGGASYQIIGVGSKTEAAKITWNEALADAKSRCYNGHPGYLAIIGSQVRKITAPCYHPSSSSSSSFFSPTSGAGATFRPLSFNPIAWSCFPFYRAHLRAPLCPQDENEYLHSLVQAAAGYSAGDNAWIGANDAGTEGTFEWVGPQKMSKGLLFWEDGKAVDGAYANWGENEPNEGGAAGLPEDCVAMYGGGEGKWYDRNW